MPQKLALRLSIFIAGLIVSLLLAGTISRFFLPFSAIQITIAEGVGEISLDGKALAFRSQIQLLKPGPHRILLTRLWHKTLRLEIEAAPVWFPFQLGQTMVCAAEPGDPHWIMSQTLAETAVNNPPWPQWVPVTDPQLGEAVLAISERVATGDKLAGKSWLSWLAQLWLVDKSPQARAAIGHYCSLLARSDWQESCLTPSQLTVEICRLLAPTAVRVNPIRFANAAPISQGQWQAFIRANPAWSGRQRPQLRARGLVGATYTKDFENSADDPKLARSAEWQSAGIRQVNLPAIVAYIAWLRASGQGEFRLPSLAELRQANGPSQPSGLEWTSEAWPPQLNLRRPLPAWLPAFSIVAHRLPNGTIKPIIVGWNDSSTEAGFRLVPIAEK